MCACVHASVWCASVRVCVCVRVRACVRAYLCARACASVYGCSSLCCSACVRSCVCACACVYVSMYYADIIACVCGHKNSYQYACFHFMSLSVYVYMCFVYSTLRNNYHMRLVCITPNHRTVSLFAGVRWLSVIFHKTSTQRPI